ncbi:MAG: hypothetical protein R3A79_19880 [Nannocystaceae bacterium]
MTTRSAPSLGLGLCACLGLAVAAPAPAAAQATPAQATPDADEVEDAAEGDAAAAASPAGDDAAQPDASGPPPPDADAPPARASLSVDTSALGAQSPVLLRRIEELGDIELRRAEILPSRHPRDPVILICLSSIADGGYAIASRLEVAGEIVANSANEVLCTLCTEGETVDRARVEVGRLIPFVRDHARAVAEAEARSRSDAAAPTGPSPSDDRRRLAPMSKAGVALLIGGVAGLGAGLGLALREPAVKPEMPLEVVDTRVPGYVALGVGGALLVTGVALLVTGQRRARASTVAIAPSPGGVLFYGRF